MLANIDTSLVDWSRAQFALTAIYHYLFVPLTLGLSFIIAMMESIYVKTKKPEWKRMTKFWMTLFGINFAIGVATGIILEFQFGTNWSNYSWFVGDIFGAPLAIEGIMAFFLESTFIAVMFFGWNKVSPKFHLASTWLVAIGSNISALWILVANGWMQDPVGMVFNPDTARNEMISFWSVFLSPMAINKFLHTISSAYVLSAMFVIGISSWFLLKKREVVFAKKSILIAAIFGLTSSLFLTFTGDGSSFNVANKQPMKLAAMEGLYKGKSGAGLVSVGMLTPGKKAFDGKDDYVFSVEIPKLLSLLSFKNSEAFVPGVEDILNGKYTSYGKDYIEPSAEEKIERGKIAINTLRDYKMAKAAKDTAQIRILGDKFKPETKEGSYFLQNFFKYFGYGYLNSPESIIPNVPLVFYSFRVMVFLGFFFIILFIVALVMILKDNFHKYRWLLWLSLLSIPLTFLASQAGWIVAEVGRQPWVIQDLMPTVAAVSHINASAVMITFALFTVLFTTLLIAEVSIMIKQIKLGPKDGGQ